MMAQLFNSATKKLTLKIRDGKIALSVIVLESTPHLPGDALYWWIDSRATLEHPACRDGILVVSNDAPRKDQPNADNECNSHDKTFRGNAPLPAYTPLVSSSSSMRKS